MMVPSTHICGAPHPHTYDHPPSFGWGGGDLSWLHCIDEK